jgi:hypothetical protein
MSIPLLDLVRLLTETFLGLANATIIAANASKRNAYNTGFNFEITELALKPLTDGMVNKAVSFFLVKKYQTANKGISISNHKNSGF